MRASRLLSLMMLLQVRGKTSAAVLARELEVSVRTIHRDVDALSLAGIPLHSETGRNGGIVLATTFRTRLTGLTSAEAEALPLAGLAFAARDLGVGADAAAAELKLLASLPPDSSANARRIATRFHLDPVPWYHLPESLGVLPRLALAVWRDRRVRVEYESWEGQSTARLEPLGLVQKGGLWYLVARSRAEPRTFRVASIRELDVLDESFQRPRNFDLARWWNRSAAEFERRLTPERATIRISEEGRRILRAVSPAAAQVVGETQQPTTTPGWVEARMPIEQGVQAARQLLRLGAEVQIVAPATLRTALLTEARAVIDRHRRAPGRPA
jgi:predicted DNA-binding transcriptional regulator YafY